MGDLYVEKRISFTVSTCDPWMILELDLDVSQSSFFLSRRFTVRGQPYRINIRTEVNVWTINNYTHQRNGSKADSFPFSALCGGSGKNWTNPERAPPSRPQSRAFHRSLSHETGSHLRPHALPSHWWDGAEWVHVSIATGWNSIIL